MFPVIKSDCTFSSITIICNEILYISSLKLTFHTDKYCQIGILVRGHTMLIEHIYLSEGNYIILLDFPLDICLLAYHCIAD